jgi:hypothetical protein
MHFQPGFTPSKRSLLESIQGVGLTDGLKLCLDAGDADSFTSGQTWFDRSGGGYDFLRGSTSAAQATDPTFNGTVGQLSANEFWSLDGGDFFTLGQSNPTWVNNLHKNNAVWSFGAWVYLPSPTTQTGIFGTAAGLAWGSGAIGVIAYTANSARHRIAVSNQTTITLLMESTGTIPASAWTFLSGSINEPTGQGFVGIDGVMEAASSTYDSPATGNAGYTLQLGTRGNGDSKMPNGSRLAMLAVWQGSALSVAGMQDIYGATKGRFGL